ncbi:MAG: hypothetical protein JST80_02290 [Bdellovibrionales bacterium]|nr:hypothetical protein [Bdellovibrionales bacterium]
MDEFLKNNLRWAAFVTIAECICYPAFYVKSDPSCSLQVKGAVPFSPEFWKYLPWIFGVVFVAGLVWSGVAKALRRPVVRPIMMILMCLPFLAFDRDYPMCNTTPPWMTIARWTGTFFLPTLLAALLESRKLLQHRRTLVR